MRATWLGDRSRESSRAFWFRATSSASLVSMARMLPSDLSVKTIRTLLSHKSNTFIYIIIT